MGNLCSGGLLDVDTNNHAGIYNEYGKYTVPHPLTVVNNSIEQKRSSHSSSPERRRQGARDGLNTAMDETEVQQDEAHRRNPATASEQLPAEAAVQELTEEQPPEPFSWTKGELIGIGAFGRVFSALNNVTGELVAVKQVSFAKDEALQGRVAEHIRALEAEVRVLKTLKHENIVRYLGTEITDDSLYIFLEYVPGGSIASLLAKFGAFPEKVIRVYTAQLLRGLEYLHQKGIMHRDIKGANILVDKQGTVKLADFGASKKIEDLATMGSGSKSIRGTPYWMAPEVIKQTGHGRPADIWSLACTVIEMATGKPPWSTYTAPVAAMFQIASSKDPPPLPEHLSREAKDFLLLCFNRVARDRANATRLLKHPFVAGVLEQQRQQPTPGTPPGGAASASNSNNSPAAPVSSSTSRAVAGNSVAGTGDVVASSRLALQHSTRQGPIGTAAHKASLAGTNISGHMSVQATKQVRSSPTQQARNSPMRQQQHSAAEAASSGTVACQRGDACAVVVASRSPLQPSVQQQQQQQHRSKPPQDVTQFKQSRSQQSPKPFDSYNQQYAQQQPEAQQHAPKQQVSSTVSPPPAPSAEGSGASEGGQEGCLTLVNWNPVSEPSWVPPYQQQHKSSSRRQPTKVSHGLESQQQQQQQQQQQAANHKQPAGRHKGTSKGMSAEPADVDCQRPAAGPSRISGIHSSSNGSIGAAAVQHMKRSSLPMNNHSLTSATTGKRGTGSSGAGPLSQGPAGRGSSTLNGMHGALAFSAGGSVLGGVATGKVKHRMPSSQGMVLQQHGAPVVSSSGSPVTTTTGASDSAAGQGTHAAASTAPAVVQDSHTAHDQSAVHNSVATTGHDEDVKITSKRVQWENELYEELERHRQEQRVARQASQATRLAGAQQS